MEYLIIYQGQAIAKITHPEADVGQGIVIGPFLPFPAYESVRAVFQISGQLIAAELESGRRNEGAWQQYYQQRDVLTQRLSITTLDDLPVETTWIDILDCSEDMGDDGYEAHFVVATPEFFKDVLLWDQKTGKNDVPFSSRKHVEALRASVLESKKAGSIGGNRAYQPPFSAGVPSTPRSDRAR